MDHDDARNWGGGQEEETSSCTGICLYNKCCGGLFKLIGKIPIIGCLIQCILLVLYNCFIVPCMNKGLAKRHNEKVTLKKLEHNKELMEMLEKIMMAVSWSSPKEEIFVMLLFPDLLFTLQYCGANEPSYMIGTAACDKCNCTLTSGCDTKWYHLPGTMKDLCGNHLMPYNRPNNFHLYKEIRIDLMLGDDLDSYSVTSVDKTSEWRCSLCFWTSPGHVFQGVPNNQNPRHKTFVQTGVTHICPECTARMLLRGGVLTLNTLRISRQPTEAAKNGFEAQLDTVNIVDADADTASRSNISRSRSKRSSRGGGGDRSGVSESAFI